MGAFDDDLATAVKTLGSAQDTLATVMGTLKMLNKREAFLQTQVSQLSSEQNTLQTEFADAQKHVVLTKSRIKKVSLEQAVLAAEEPKTTIEQPNPEYAIWQQRVAVLQKTLELAKARAVALQPAVDAAQIAADQTSGEEPELLLPNGHPNTAHKAWQIRMNSLIIALKKAKADETSAQQDMALAEAAVNAAVNTPPSVTIIVANPDHALWQQQFDKISIQLKDVQAEYAAANTQVVNIQAQISADTMALQSMQQELQTITVQIDSVSRDYDAANQAVVIAQAQIDKMRRWVAVLTGTSIDPARAIEVATELINRLVPAEDASCDAESVVNRSNETLWRLTARVDELTRRRDQVEKDLKTLENAKMTADAAKAAVAAKIAEGPG